MSEFDREHLVPQATRRVASNAMLDRAAGTELGALWLLLPFALVAVLVAAVSAGDGGLLALTWAGIAIVALATFVWAWFERRASRGVLRRLAPGGDRALAREGDAPLRQYRVVVGMVVLEVAFRTRPHSRTRPMVPTLVTLLLGWWSLPWGPIHTIAAVVCNLRGGEVTSAVELRARLGAAAPPPVAWWRRLLALDNGSTLQVVANLAILLVLTLLGLLLLAAVVRAVAWEG